jgi:creatinine amidohydrolase
VVKSYKWHELSGPEVAQLSGETDVAILPIGCVEMHGPHLPTGTDAWTAEGMAVMIAERESAVVLPTLFYNINDEMMCYPGTISISPELMLRLYEEICSEAARNGFRRIVLLVGHGGSEHVTDFFQHSLLQRREHVRLGYGVFRIYYPSLVQLAAQQFESGEESGGHGGEVETSFVLHFRPDLVHQGMLPADADGPYLDKSIPGATYFVDWIRRVPRGYHGRPDLATPEKGKAAATAIADHCAQIVRQIKAFDLGHDR